MVSKDGLSSKENRLSEEEMRYIRRAKKLKIVVYTLAGVLVVLVVNLVIRSNFDDKIYNSYDKALIITTYNNERHIVEYVDKNEYGLPFNKYMDLIDRGNTYEDDDITNKQPLSDVLNKHEIEDLQTVENNKDALMASRYGSKDDLLDAYASEQEYTKRLSIYDSHAKTAR